MRPSSKFPEGFGFDPTMTVGTPARGISRNNPQRGDDTRPTSALGLQQESPAGHVPGPFSPASFPWEADDITPSARHAALLADGSHFDRRDDMGEGGDTRRIEPQSVVVTTALVGILLATMGYFLDLR